MRSDGALSLELLLIMIRVDTIYHDDILKDLV